MSWRNVGPLLVIIGLLIAGAYEAAHNEGERVVGGLLIGAGLVMLGAWLSSEIREDLRDADLDRARKARRVLQAEESRAATKALNQLDRPQTASSYDYLVGEYAEEYEERKRRDAKKAAPPPGKAPPSKPPKPPRGEDPL